MEFLDGCDALAMYHAEEMTIPMMFGLLPDYLAKTSWLKSPITSVSVLIDLDDTGTSVSSGPLPLQSSVKNATILPRSKNHRNFGRREV